MGEAFVEEGYTSGGGDSNVTAEGGTSGSSVTAMTVGRGNLSSAIASETAKTLLARSQSSYTLAATIYEHAYWGGAYMGDSWNDQLSSLTIYPNWCLTLYEHISYSGSWRRMCAGSSTWRISYVGDDWNDKVSSIRVSVRR